MNCSLDEDRLFSNVLKMSGKSINSVVNEAQRLRDKEATEAGQPLGYFRPRRHTQPQFTLPDSTDEEEDVPPKKKLRKRSDDGPVYRERGNAAAERRRVVLDDDEEVNNNHRVQHNYKPFGISGEQCSFECSGSGRGGGALVKRIQKKRQSEEH